MAYAIEKQQLVRLRLDRTKRSLIFFFTDENWVGLQLLMQFILLTTEPVYYVRLN